MAGTRKRVKVTWSIDGELVKKLKHEAIDLETDVSTIIEGAVKDWLGKRSGIAARKAWETRKQNAEQE